MASDPLDEDVAPTMGGGDINLGNGHVVHWWHGPTMWAWTCDCEAHEISKAAEGPLAGSLRSHAATVSP